MKSLSSSAQAVLDAVEDHGKFVYFAYGFTWIAPVFRSPCNLAAAALRAAADQVVPAEPENEDLDPCNPDDKAEWAQYSQRQHTRSQLLAIAAELEGADG